MSPSRLNDCWLMQHTKSEVLSGGLLVSRIQAFSELGFNTPGESHVNEYTAGTWPILLHLAWGHMPAFMQIVLVKSWLDI